MNKLHRSVKDAIDSASSPADFACLLQDILSGRSYWYETNVLELVNMLTVTGERDKAWKYLEKTCRFIMDNPESFTAEYLLTTDLLINLGSAYFKLTDNDGGDTEIEEETLTCLKKARELVILSENLAAKEKSFDAWARSIDALSDVGVKNAGRRALKMLKALSDSRPVETDELLWVFMTLVRAEKFDLAKQLIDRMPPADRAQAYMLLACKDYPEGSCDRLLFDNALEELEKADAFEMNEALIAIVRALAAHGLFEDALTLAWKIKEDRAEACVAIAKGMAGNKPYSHCMPFNVAAISCFTDAEQDCLCQSEGESPFLNQVLNMTEEALFDTDGHRNYRLMAEQAIVYRSFALTERGKTFISIMEDHALQEEYEDQRLTGLVNVVRARLALCLTEEVPEIIGRILSSEIFNFIDRGYLDTDSGILFDLALVLAEYNISLEDQLLLPLDSGSSPDNQVDLFRKHLLAIHEIVSGESVLPDSFLLTNMEPAGTGLPVTVSPEAASYSVTLDNCPGWVWILTSLNDGIVSEDVRISLELKPQIFGAISQEIADKVIKWIKLNYNMLIDYHYGRISSEEILKKVKKISNCRQRAVKKRKGD